MDETVAGKNTVQGGNSRVLVGLAAPALIGLATAAVMHFFQAQLFADLTNPFLTVTAECARFAEWAGR